MPLLYLLKVKLIAMFLLKKKTNCSVTYMYLYIHQVKTK